MKTGGSRSFLRIPRQGLALPGAAPGHFPPAPRVVASSISFVSVQTRKLTHFAASPFPMESFDFMGAPLRAAGRTAGGGFSLGLFGSAAGRTAGSGLFLGFSGCAAGGTAGSGLFLRLVNSAASGTGPVGQMRERHNDYLLICLSNISVRKFILAQPYNSKQVRTKK